MKLRTTILTLLAALMLTAVALPTASAQDDDPCTYKGPARDKVCGAQGTVHNVSYCIEYPNDPDCPGSDRIGDLLYVLFHSYEKCIKNYDPDECYLGAFAELLDKLDLDR